MERSLEARAHHLLQISIDLHNRMAEIKTLREMVRTAEAAESGQRPFYVAAVPKLLSDELRV